MSDLSVSVLTKHLKTQLGRLAVLQEYRVEVDDPYARSALAFAIEDIQEGIARVASRLRQLDHPLMDDTLDGAARQMVQRARARRSLADKLKFVWQDLKGQLEWYGSQARNLQDDPDSQAILVALAEQARVRLDRWENLLKELKVSLD